MKEGYVKRFIAKDGKTRMTIYRDNDADSPRDMTDEPFHCEDWSRDYSVMTHQERQTKSDNACGWVRYMLERYGNLKAIIKVLRENAKADKHTEGDNALTYDALRHEWIISCWVDGWTDAEGKKRGDCWCEDVSWAVKMKDLQLYHIVDYLSNEMIDIFADKRYFTDGIKIGSYSFGYYGSISFCDSFSVDSEGICWLEKDEFLNYSGCKEENWKEKSLTEIEFLCKELDAWADNEVYGYVVEHKDVVKVREEHEDGTVTEYERTDWNEEVGDSVWGYYGELDKMVPYMLEDANLKQEDFNEE